MERVLGIDNHPDRDDARTEVIDFAVQPWLAGATVATVQLTVGGIRPRRRKPNPRR